MGGYVGKILRINLTEREIKTEPLDMDLARKYLSGRGLAGKMFIDEVEADVDPLSPENKIYIATGVLTGTKAPTSGRFMVVTKSPLNEAISSSNSGGYWGVQLKFAGYDMAVLEGKAAQPVYIAIKDDLVEIKDASHLWGMDAYASTEALKREFGEPGAKVLTIGPAGENLSFLAMFMNDLRRVAGRGGVGAIFGSKNVKALVVRGTGKVGTADPAALKEVLRADLGKFKENGLTEEEPDLLEEEAAAEGDDAAEGDGAPEKDGKNDACYRCPIVCGRHKRGKGGQSGNSKQVRKSSFGSDCGLQDYEAIQAANDLCNKFGMDAVSVGVTLATGMELVRQGRVQPEELGGKPLEFGEAQSVLEWIRKIAYGEGFGAKMALGSYILAEGYGRPELAMTLKRMEVPAYDRKERHGQDLEFATSNRGGGHVREHTVAPERLGLAPDFALDTLEGKAVWVKTLQDLTAVIDSLGLCLFTSAALNLSDYRLLVNAATGFNYTDEELLTCGERIWNVERIQLVREEYSPLEDMPPENVLEVEIPAGPPQGDSLDLQELLKAYYKERSWDADGVPTIGCLQDLEIMDVKTMTLWGFQPDDEM